MQDDRQRMRAWLEARRRLITATDLASIMRVPGAYSSPMGVYLSKTEPLPEDTGPVPEHMVWGNRLQRPILDGYSEVTGAPIEHCDPYQVHVSKPFPILGASLDARWAAGALDHRPVDAKNVAVKKVDEWGEEGGEDVPLRFYLQLQAQMIVTGEGVAELAVLFGGRHLGIYRVHLDKDVASGIVEAAERFWRSHVLPNVPPPVDESDEWTRYLSSRRQETELLLTADAAQNDMADELAATQAAMKELEAEHAKLTNLLKAGIGENQGIVGEGWRATFKQRKEVESTDWEAVARGLAVGREDALKILLQQHTTRKPGARVFLFRRTE